LFWVCIYIFPLNLLKANIYNILALILNPVAFAKYSVYINLLPRWKSNKEYWWLVFSDKSSKLAFTGSISFAKSERINAAEEEIIDKVFFVSE